MTKDDDAKVEAERFFPEFANALREGQASFSLLTMAWLGRAKASGLLPEQQEACIYYYPLLLDAFQASHGVMVDVLHMRAIQAHAARTDPVELSAGATNEAAPRIADRSRESDMHLLYDLSRVAFGGDRLTRIEMLTADASRLLSGQKLRDCLDQLYSTTGDLLGLMAAAQDPSRSTADGEPKPVDKLHFIDHDLAVVQGKFLLTTARLKYFQGALLGAAAAVLFDALALLALLVAQHFFGPSFDLGAAVYLAWLFGTAGALISVVQRLSSGQLDLRYDVGPSYTRLLGFLRPWIGAFGGLFLWVLNQAGLILHPGVSAFYLAAIAFGFGIAERTLGDIVTQSGVGDLPLTPTGAPQGSVPAALGPAQSASAPSRLRRALRCRPSKGG